MKLIRNGVFETNSSSCHSVSLGSGDVLTSITPDDNGVITLHAMDFGWEYDQYNDAATKLTYLWIYARDWTTGNSDSKIAHLEPLEYLDKLISVVLEHTGAVEIVFKDNGISYGTNLDLGYIDHQSVEGRDYDYLWDKDLLKTFIFDPKSTLTTDNDNH